MSLAVLALLALIALIPAKIASNKGESFWTFYFFGVLLWIVAVIWAIVMKTNDPSVRTAQRLCRRRRGYVRTVSVTSRRARRACRW